MFTTDMEPRFSFVLRCGPCATDPEQRCEHRSAILSWNHCGRMELEDSVVSPSMTLSTPAGQFCVCYSASLELQHCHLSVRWEQWYSMNWVWTLNKTNKTFSAPPNSIYEGPEWSFSFHKMKKKNKNTGNKIHKASPFARSSIHPKTVSITPMAPTSDTRTKSPEEKLSAQSPKPDLWRVEPTFCTSSHHQPSLLPTFFLIRPSRVLPQRLLAKGKAGWLASQKTMHGFGSYPQKPLT